MNRFESKLEDQSCESIVIELRKGLDEALAAVQEAHNQFVAAALVDPDYDPEIPEDWIHAKSIKSIEEYISMEESVEEIVPTLYAEDYQHKDDKLELVELRLHVEARKSLPGKRSGEAVSGGYRCNRLWGLVWANCFERICSPSAFWQDPN